MGWNKSDIKTKAPTEAYRKGWEGIDWGKKPKSIQIDPRKSTINISGLLSDCNKILRHASMDANFDTPTPKE